MCVKTGSYNLYCIILYILYYIISNIIIYILLNPVLFIVLLLCRLSVPSPRHGANPPRELTVFSGLGICRIPHPAPRLLKRTAALAVGVPSHAGRVSSETCFVSKQPKLEPKLVSALSETRRLFWLFLFNIEIGSFGVSKQPKQIKEQPKQQQIC